jgi:hypothetical protein
MLNGKTREDCPNVSTACNNCILNNKTHILPRKYTNRRFLKIKTARRGLKYILSQAGTQHSCSPHSVKGIFRCVLSLERFQVVSRAIK